MSLQQILLISCGVLFSSLVQAHEPGVFTNDLLHGFAHPFAGWDHLFLIFGVGVYSAVSVARSGLLLPLLLLCGMLAGAVSGVFELTLPAVEPMVAMSLVLTGGLIALNARPRMGLLLAMVAVSGVFHGHLHVIEAAPHSDLPGYATGFLLASALLTVLGAGIGQLYRLPVGRLGLRIGGGTLAIAGAGLLSGML